MFRINRVFLLSIAMLWIAAFLLYNFSHYLMWGLVHKLDIPSNNLAFWALSVSFTLVLASVFVAYPIRRTARQPLHGLVDPSPGPREIAKAISSAIFATWIIYSLGSLGEHYLLGNWSVIVDRGQLGLYLLISALYLIVCELLGILIGTPILAYLKSRRALSPFTIVIVAATIPVLFLFIIGWSLAPGESFSSGDSVGKLVTNGSRTPLGWLKDVVSLVGAFAYGAIAGVICQSFLNRTRTQN